MNKYHQLLTNVTNDLAETIEEKRKDNPNIDESITNYTVELICEKHYQYFNNNKEELLNECKQSDTEFSNHIYDVWKDALDILELIIGIVAESANMYTNTFCSQAEEDDNKMFPALRTIHARAILISKECLVLLKNGYPDGAFSLWRSIYELSVIADFLFSKQDLDLCQRYIDYYHIQIYREERENRKHGYPHYTDKAFRIIKQNYSEVINKYGDGFNNGFYGWASKYFDNKNVSFQKIEKESNLNRLRGFYVASSTFIHGNHKANQSPLGLIPNTDAFLIVGPSDYGLSIPIQNVAISLVNTTALFLGAYPTVDSMSICSLLEKYLKKLRETAVDIQKSIEENNEDMKAKASD